MKAAPVESCKKQGLGIGNRRLTLPYSHWASTQIIVAAITRPPQDRPIDESRPLSPSARLLRARTAGRRRGEWRRGELRPVRDHGAGYRPSPARGRSGTRGPLCPGDTGRCPASGRDLRDLAAGGDSASAGLALAAGG